MRSLFDLAKPLMASLENRMAAGAAWMVAFKLLDRSIGVVSIVILARLLTPADFGLVAIATAVIAIVELLSSFNFDIALIQDQDARKGKYNTAWTLNVALGTVCATLAAILAVPIAAFFGEPRLVPIVCILAVATWIRGFENIGIVAFRKELALHREFRLLLIRRLSAFVATVCVAVIVRSYWALVAGILVGNLVGVVLSYVMHPYRPRFDLSARDELLRFSKWLVASSVLSAINARMADLVVGKALAPGSLGLFNLAHELANLPTAELTAPINRAVFPGYSRVASDQRALRSQYLSVQGVVALVTTPAAVGIAVLAPVLVPLLLGSAWRGAIPLLEILSIAGLIASWRTNSGYVLLAMRRPGLLTLMDAARLGLTLPALALGVTFFGLQGAAWAMLAASILMFPVTHSLVSRVAEILWTDYARVLWRPIVAAAVMGLTVRGYLDRFDTELTIWMTTLACLSAVGLGVVLYVALVALLWAIAGFPDSAEASARGAAMKLCSRWMERRSKRKDG